MKKKVRSNYVDNQKFLEEISAYVDKYNEAKKNGDPLPRINNYIGKTIIDIATRFAQKYNFSGYSYKQEMIDDGVENCIRYLHLFDKNKSSNPFAYYTRICYFAFIRRITREHKEEYVKAKLMENAINMGFSEALSPEEQAVFDNHMRMDPDKIKKLYDKFEKKKKEKDDVGIEEFLEGEDD